MSALGKILDNNNIYNIISNVGIDVGSGCGFSRVGGELQELHTQSLIRLYSAAF